MYYTQEEDLMLDAKKTELEAASARLLLAKLRAAFISGKLQIMRTVFVLLSVASLLLPHYSLSLSFPWWEYSLSVGALGIYNIISDSFLSAFFTLGKLGAGTALHTLTAASFILLIACALFLIISLVFWICGFINIRKTALMSFIFSVPAIICQLTGTVLSFFAVTLSGSLEHISAKPFFGGILSALIIGVFAVSGLLVYLNPPSPVLKDADRRRLEIKEKIKNGEMTYDDIPLPVVEEIKTEEPAEKKKRGKKK
ncbi:MAG: hypothetical protein IKB08_09910 [Clostridia bacterium]|nr:hypothetical protein [Clostridia bacterium]